MRGVMLAVVVALSGCAGLSPRIAVPAEEHAKCGPQPTETEAAAAVSSWANQALLDPSSAQTRGVRVADRQAWQGRLSQDAAYVYGWVVAFEVNAKNGYGGYAGWRPREILVLPDRSVRW